MRITRRRFMQASGAALVGLSAPFVPTLRAQESRKLSVGAILTLTGGNAPTGTSIRDGARVAVEAVNAAGGVGGRYELELLVEDSRTSQSEAVNAASRLASRGDVSFVVGPIISSFGLAVQPILSAAGIPHIYFGADRTFTDQHDRFPLSFNYGSDVALQYAPLAQYAVEERGQGNIYVLAQNNERGQAAIELIRGQLDRLGAGRVVGTDLYPSFNRDFSTLVTKVRNSGADALFLVTGIPAELIGAAQEFVRQGLSFDDLGFYTGQTPNGAADFWEAVSNAGDADGLIYSWLYASPAMERVFDAPIPSLEQSGEMERAFADVLGRAPISGQTEAWGWGGLQIIKQAIEGLMAREGEAAVAALDPVRELPRAVASFMLPDGGSEPGPVFRTPFGQAGYLPCGQFDTRLGVATFREGQQYLLEPRGFGEALVGPLCT